MGRTRRAIVASVLALWMCSLAGTALAKETCADCGRHSQDTSCACSGSCSTYKTCKLCCDNQKLHTVLWGLGGKETKRLAHDKCKADCLTDVATAG